MRMVSLTFASVLGSGAIFFAFAGKRLRDCRTEHPLFPHMEAGCDATVGELILGWCFGVCLISFCCALFSLGFRPRAYPLVRWIAIGWVGVWTVLISSLIWGDADAVVLSFPLPTSLMLYLLWPLPFLLSAMYCLRFHDTHDFAQASREEALAATKESP